VEAPRDWVSINGAVVAGADARVSVFDSGFMQGIGLFETMRTYHGRVFRLGAHLARLTASAGQLGWTTRPVESELADEVERLVHALPAGDYRVRLTVTTGSLHAASGDEAKLTRVVTASGGAAYPAEYYQRGITVTLARCRQNGSDPTTGHKTTSYFARLASLREAHLRQATETLWFTPDNELAEGAISNVFVVSEEGLLTPPLDTPVLPGITRAAVIELAELLKIPVVQRPLALEDVLEAEEVFLTNALMEVMPVVRVERDRISVERPGPITRLLHEAYQALVGQECSRG